MDSWLAFVIFLVVLNAYFLLLYVLVKTGWLARLNMSLFGPAIMIKTGRGRGLLDWFAKAPTFWDLFASFGLFLTIAMMVAMTALLILQVPLIFQLTPEQAPSPRLILGIPGINPVIPLGYGILALIFAVVVHEFSHGIMARVYKLRVKSMGLLFLVIPVGAFVEPDEEELKAAPRRQRVRVFSAGPLSNIVFAILFAFLFSPLLMGAAQPVPGAPVNTVEVDGPACQAGLLPSWVITHMGANENKSEAQAVRDTSDLTERLRNTPPNTTHTFFVRNADVSGKLEGHRCINATNVAAGTFPVTTVRCADFYKNETCLESGRGLNASQALNRSVIGFGPYPHAEIHEGLADPMSSGGAFLQYLMLPFLSITGQFPLSEPFTDFYETPFDAAWFWPLANTVYWLFWINLMLGLTNALPIVPLDGGHMYRDFIAGTLGRTHPRMTLERRDAVVGKVAKWTALTLLFLVLLQFIGPYFGSLFA